MLEQQFFLMKLLGFLYTIIYKKGKENIVANALSRRSKKEDTVEDGQLITIVSSFMLWIKNLKGTHGLGKFDRN